MRIGAVNNANYYGAIASGKRINSAADDAAGSNIAEKLKSQGNATSAALDNTKAGISAMNIADGSLSGITDYLQSIKQLSVKAANGLYTKSDKQAIQDQIEQYKQGIMDTVNSSQYNTLNLLDGSNSNLGIVSKADGTATNVSMGQMALESLGIADYDVTGDFDMSKIDDAIAYVSKNRSNVGASTNMLEAAYNYGSNSYEQLTSSLSRKEDLDIPGAVSDMQKNKLLQSMQLMMQKKKMEEDAQSKNIVNMML